MIHVLIVEMCTVIQGTLRGDGHNQAAILIHYQLKCSLYKTWDQLTMNELSNASLKYETYEIAIEIPASDLLMKTFFCTETWVYMHVD